MPSISKAQQRLMGAAEHGADFPMAKKLRKSMTHAQLHDFAVGSMKNKPEHTGLLNGNRPDIMKINAKTMKKNGFGEVDATKAAIQKAHPNRHKNLGAFLHKSKDKPEYPGDSKD